MNAYKVTYKSGATATIESLSNAEVKYLTTRYKNERTDVATITKLEPKLVRANLHIGDSIEVVPEWAGVDRPTTGGISLPNKPRYLALAKRLVRAIEAGKAFVPVAIKIDIHGSSYVETRNVVFGKTLNADLKRIGF